MAHPWLMKIWNALTSWTSIYVEKDLQVKAAGGSFGKHARWEYTALSTEKVMGISAIVVINNRLLFSENVSSFIRDLGWSNEGFPVPNYF